MRSDKREPIKSKNYGKWEVSIAEGAGQNIFENDLIIDPLALDMEWLEQPNLFMRYSKKLAETRKEKDETKKRLLVARAKLRAKLIDSGAKGTNEVVEENIASTQEWEDHIQACYEEDLLDGAVKAMSQRKTALENLVDLLGMQYFAGPKEPRDYTKTTSRTETRARVGNALNKKEGGSE